MVIAIGWESISRALLRYTLSCSLACAEVLVSVLLPQGVRIAAGRAASRLAAADPAGLLPGCAQVGTHAPCCY